MFCKYAYQLSEIFWETMDEFVDDYQQLIVAPIDAFFIKERAEYFAKAVQNKNGALDNCIGFIDGTNIAIERLGDDGSRSIV